MNDWKQITRLAYYPTGLQFYNIHIGEKVIKLL